MGALDVRQLPAIRAARTIERQTRWILGDIESETGLEPSTANAPPSRPSGLFSVLERLDAAARELKVAPSVESLRDQDLEVARELHRLLDRTVTTLNDAEDLLHEHPVARREVLLQRLFELREHVIELDHGVLDIIDERDLLLDETERSEPWDRVKARLGLPV